MIDFSDGLAEVSAYSDVGLVGEVDVNPALRLVAMYRWLLQRGRITPGELQRRYRLTRRQLEEDRKKLLKIPGVVQHGGAERAFAIDPTEALDTLGHLDRIALLLGRDLTGFFTGTSLARPWVQLDAETSELPAALRRRFHQKFLAVHEPERRYDEHTEALDDVLDGIVRERRIACIYVSGGRAQTIDALEPLSLLLYRRAIYVIGRPGPEAAPKLYAVERMRETNVGEPFVWPTGWDPRAFLGERFGVFADPGSRPEAVVLRFDADRLDLLRSRVWHPTQRVVVADDGTVELHLRSHGRELVRFVLEWGAAVEVVKPASLRSAVLAELRGALARYETTM
jgi:predicted DNA-binding transcriptional regulator YafY